MPAWLIPVLKAILPHVVSIISTTAPVFTKKRGDAATNQAILLQQQITELQTAASRNDAQIKKLAIQIQGTLEALEKAVSIAEGGRRRILLFCIAATVLAIMSLGIALFILAAR